MTTTPRPADPRPVIQGETPTRHASVQRALDTLHEGPTSLEALATTLAAGLEAGRDDVLVDRPSRLLYATDASIYEMEPVAVVFPRSAEDVQHAVRVANDTGVPLLPRGAGTSLAGQAVNHAIVLDCSRHLNRLVEVNVEERWARVEPGLVIDELNRELRPYGLNYTVDPSTKNRATVGGGIGNNSCGTHSVLYGKTLEQVIDLDVVLADGTATTFEELAGTRLEAKLDLPGLEGAAYRGTRRIAHAQREAIAEHYPKIQRRVSGYNLDEFTGDGPMNLARVIVGSEGTLAVATSARVRLEPLPVARGLAVLHFESVPAACAATMAALEHEPAAIELIDNVIIERCRESIGYASLVDFVVGDPGALLLIELFGDDETAIQARLDALATDLEARAGAYATHSTTNAGEQLRLWRMRQAGLGVLMSVKGDAKPVALVEDTAVPPERLADFVTRFDAVVQAHGTTAAYYGHASVGCLHIRPMINVKQSEGLDVAESIASDVADLVLEFGGSLSGEHGDGILRGVFTERMFGPELTEAFRELKRTFDPRGLLNPGKIIDTPPLRDNLRLGPDTVNLLPPTYLDFSADGGLARAVELCNGQGACRKDDGGMCPSYMVTADEEHSTRGRANLLRQALNGVIPASELAGERVYDALDLCVECKACKAECPSGVDMAKLKYEVLTAYHERHGVPLRSRLFGRIATGARVATALPALVPVANAIARLAPVRALLERTIGIHRRRSLPTFARHRFRRWFADRAPTAHAPRGEVVFFDDTFTQYFHPEAGQAAVRVLEALGYRVTVVQRLGCCGRPLISKGQLAEAREWAQQAVEVLLPYAQRGLPIVGIEPSCLLTLRDEYPDLLRNDDAKTVAGAARLLDELIVELAAGDGSVRDIFEGAPTSRALLHAHCHQKALVGAEPTLEALALVPGLEVELVDSACCGMAGSFGFEAEHYEISEAMARRSLIPAVEGASDDTEILVTGVSCRQQIDHFSSRRPRHAVELLADSLR